MSETLKRGAGLLTLEDCTAASNFAAGTPLMIGTATNTVYSMGTQTTGHGCTGLLGYHFIGICDKAYSAGDCPITVWTKGVFKMYTHGDNSATAVQPGYAVFAQSGLNVYLGITVDTGDVAIGSVVSQPASASSSWLDVKINPGRYRFMYYTPNSVTATSTPAMGFPKYQR